MGEVEVVNAGAGPVVAGDKLLWPGETGRLAQGAVDAVNAVHGAGTLVVVGVAPAPVVVAPVEEVAAGGGKKGKK